MITILAGGSGSVKLVRGFASQRTDVNVVTNVGDNYWLYGLYICPDIDTITYGLADILDQDKGWGIKKDTFGFLRQMEVFGEETWFRIGDRDTATQLTRTNLLKNGKGDKDKNIQRVQVIKKVVNTGLKYEDFYDTIASWDKYGGQDYSTDFESE